MEKDLEQKLIHLSAKIRNKSLEMAYRSGNNGAHLGGALSLVEVFATLYGAVAEIKPINPANLPGNPINQENPGRDRVIVSKGHCVLSYYSALHEMGFISTEELEKFETNGSLLHGHATRNLSLGIEFSGGSLGMGLSFSVGVAMAGKANRKEYRVFAIIGDGECNEGIIWESFMAAAHYRLDNLTVIIDSNKLQYDGNVRTVMNMGNLKSKLEAFGFHVREVDGHSVSELLEALQSFQVGMPLAVVANTVKGKGVSFMENKKEWHYGILSKDLYDQAMSEQILN